MPTDTLARIDGVELCSVGTWAASKGDGTLTTDDLADIVAAAQAEHADRAPIKIGHDDNRFQDADGNPPAAGDGSPAYGWVENLRLDGNGTKVVGDLVGIPPKLAEALPTAFRHRSVELLRSKRIGDRIYRAALTGLAVLGMAPPAVKGLADVLALYAAAPAEAAVIEVRDTPTVPPAAVSAPDGVHASGTQFGGATVALSPEVRKALGLADDATDDQITEALKAKGLALAPDEPPAPAAPATPAAPPAPAAPAAAEPPAAPTDGPEPPPVAASAAPVVQVEAAAFSAVQTELAELRTWQAQRVAADDKARRDGILAAAVKAGKVHPTSSAHFRVLLDSDETGTTTLLTAMPAVLPVAALGHAQAGDPSADSAVDDERAKLSFLPGYKSQKGA